MRISLASGALRGSALLVFVVAAFSIRNNLIEMLNNVIEHALLTKMPKRMRRGSPRLQI
jgi:hypothetical protein